MIQGHTDYVQIKNFKRGDRIFHQVSYVRCVTRVFTTGYIICLKMDKDTQPLSQNTDEDTENVAPTESTSWGLLFWASDRDLDTERLRYDFIFFVSVFCELNWEF